MRSNVFRRGAVYWWRRSVHFSFGGPHPKMVRLSLKTTDYASARTRAAWLEMDVPKVEQEVRCKIAAGLQPCDFARVYRLAFQSSLNRFLADQAKTPWLEEEHKKANLDYARHFTMIANSETEPRPGVALMAALQSQGLDCGSIERMQSIAVAHKDGSALRSDYIAAFLREAGCSTSTGNIEAVRRTVAAAYRGGALAALEALGEPDPRAELPQLAAALRAVLPVEPVYATLNDLPTSSNSPAPAHQNITAPAGNDPAPLSQPANPLVSQDLPAGAELLATLRISQLAKMAVETNVDAGKWSATCRGDVAAAVNLFVAACGDLPVASIVQVHLSDMKKLFSKLPRVYGKKKRGSTKDNPIYETIHEALIRGENDRALWDLDAVAASKAGVEKPGLSVTTSNKHLQWIDAVFAFADSRWNYQVKADASKLKEKDMRAPNKKRRPWSHGDLAKLISGPAWEGGADITHRLIPGTTIVHDAMYWSLPLLVAHAARSEEVNGLRLEDIVDEVESPYIRYRHHSYRRLKNDYSERVLPIPQGLIDLGFIEYVRALRLAGGDLLFPELWNGRSFDKAFRDKVFYPLMKLHFPAGTSRKAGAKDVDVHSIRATGLTELDRLKYDTNDRARFAGHRPIGEATLTYSDDAEAAHFKDMVEELWKLVPPINPAPINLRPAEMLKFGTSKGRPKKTPIS